MREVFLLESILILKEILWRINFVLIKFLPNALLFEKLQNEWKNPIFLHKVTYIRPDHTGGVAKFHIQLPQNPYDFHKIFLKLRRSLHKFPIFTLHSSKMFLQRFWIPSTFNKHIFLYNSFQNSLTFYFHKILHLFQMCIFQKTDLNFQKNFHSKFAKKFFDSFHN